VLRYTERPGGLIIARKQSGKRILADPSKWIREDEDVRLMLDFQRGREEAFALLVERNQTRIYALVYRLVNDHALAEDLTQEVFLRVFRAAHRYRPMARFSTWAHRIAANVALNAIRSRKKREMSGLDMHDGEDGTSWHRDVPDERGAPPQADMDTAELAAKINESILELPENQRIAITLNKYEHMSYQEIADILHCSTMAVKSLLARARCNLREALGRYLGGDFAKNFESDET